MYGYGLATHDVPRLLTTIDVGEQLTKVGLFECFGPLECGENIVLELRFEHLFFLVVPPALGLHEQSETRDWVIYLLPILDLLPPTVCKRVVGGRMMTDTICHGFDQYSASAFEASSARLLDGIKDCEDIVAIHPDGVDTIPGSTCGYPVATILFVGRSGNSKAVVACQENGWGWDGGSKKHSGVEITF